MMTAWDDVWMQVAAAIAHRSLCSRAEVGAVIVTMSNRIVATGYNGPPAGFDHTAACTLWCPRAIRPERDPGYLDCPSIHAETNAIAFCDRRDREGGTLYVTTTICYTCAKLVANSGLHRIVYPDDAPHRNGDRSLRLMQQAGLQVDLW